MQTLSDFEQDIIDAVIDLWRDHQKSRACWWQTFQTHALKLIIIYVVHQNISLTCQCNLMHLMASFS